MVTELKVIRKYTELLHNLLCTFKALFFLSVSSSSPTKYRISTLSLKSFWGLFLIAGLAALLALIIFVVMFVYRERNVLRSSDSTASIWSRIENFFRIFIQRDSTSSTFRQSDPNDRNGISLPTMCEPSPSAYSVDTEYPANRSSTSYDSSPNREAPH